MQVKFDYESIHEKISVDQFFNELRTFLEEVMTDAVFTIVLNEYDKLYEERVLVSLVHTWSEVNSIYDDLNSAMKYDERDSYYRHVESEWSTLSQAIAMLL